MASRHLSRSVVLQALFECDIKNALSSKNAQAALLRNLDDSVGADADAPFATALLTSILEKKDEIDAIIVKAAPQWPLDKIAPIDRNVLRIGLFELLFGNRDAVPPKVALNEAIELAKSFGGDSSGKFINGVLGTVYHDIGSPGKEDVSKNYAPATHENLGGVLLTASVNGIIQVALVRDAFGAWTLPKAHCKANELSHSAAMRAMKDELGASGIISGPLGEHEYRAHEPHAGLVVRTVGYFLARIDAPVPLKCTIGKGIMDARWFSETELSALEMYEDLRPVIEAGIDAAKTL